MQSLSPTFKAGFSLLVATMASVPVLAQSSVSEDSLLGAPVTQAWVDACNASSFFKDRAHSTNLAEAAKGLSILAAASESDALSKLSANEACLSIAASASMGRPVVSLVQSIDASIGIHEGIVQTNPRQAQSMTLAHRLDDLRLDLYSQQLLASEAYQSWHKADPDMALSILNQGIAQASQTQSRSYAVHNAEATTCLVVVQPKPILDDFLTLAAPTLTQALSGTDRQWLTQYADATEFWHEVGHCEVFEKTGESQGQSASSVNGPAASSCGAVQDNRSLLTQLAGNQALLEGEAASQTENKSEVSQDTSELADNDAFFEPGYQPTAEQNAVFGQVKDNRILIEMSYEALMDRNGMNVVAHRFGIPESGCSPTKTPNHPWTKLRTLWSIGDPDIRYLTWLTPWLEGLDGDTQRQVMADAWRGLLNAKKRVSGKVFYQDWLLTRMAEQRQNNNLYTPDLVADAERSDRWEAWLLVVTDQPDTITKALDQAAKL
jgi:hypothetical protein